MKWNKWIKMMSSSSLHNRKILRADHQPGIIKQMTRSVRRLTSSLACRSMKDHRRRWPKEVCLAKVASCPAYSPFIQWEHSLARMLNKLQQRSGFSARDKPMPPERKEIEAYSRSIRKRLRMRKKRRKMIRRDTMICGTQESTLHLRGKRIIRWYLTRQR